MKQVYPVSPAPAANGETTASRDQARVPTLPHEQDESSHSQAQATPGQVSQGKQALADATDGTADTDRGAVVDKVYNEKVAPDRGAEPPRQ